MSVAVGDLAARDPARRFWLAFAEAEGALWEDAGDKVLLVLPEHLQAALELGEEVAVTFDPDVAREDGALLLVPGHHVLDGAAWRVLEGGDAAVVRLPWPETAAPDAGDILARARERLGVDHGRIDPSGNPPAATWLPILRVGALVRYRVSLEDRFQEREEAWVDARTGLAIPGEAVARLDRSGGGSRGPAPARRTLPADLLRALAGAHALLQSRAAARRDELAVQAAGALRDEVARARAYYEGVLASIARRRATAPAERRAVLDEQARVTEAERARRLQEIEEGFRPEHEIHPFRLHLVLVPALTLPVLVRRGHRVYPLPLTWILHASALAPVACPHCGAGEGLVAGRERLGCRACLPRRVEPAPVPATSPWPEASAKAPVPGSRPPSPTGSPGGTASGAPPPSRGPGPRGHRRPGTGRSAAKPAGRSLDRLLTSSITAKAGRRLAGRFWETMALGRRWPRRAMIPGSPFWVLDHLYGADAPAVALGMPRGAVPMEATMATLGRDPFQPRMTMGHVLVDRDIYPYGLVWRSVAGTACVEEVLPTDDPMARLPRRADLHPDLVERLFDALPDPPVDLDPVARALWDVELPLRGLPFVARALATWWRLEDARAVAAHPVGALAAAVAMVTGQASGLRPKLPEAAGAHAVDPDAVGEALSDLRQLLEGSG